MVVEDLGEALHKLEEEVIKPAARGIIAAYGAAMLGAAQKRAAPVARTGTHLRSIRLAPGAPNFALGSSPQDPETARREIEDSDATSAYLSVNVPYAMKLEPPRALSKDAPEGIVTPAREDVEIGEIAVGVLERLVRSHA